MLDLLYFKDLPQKKLKKANEGQKGQIKGQTQENIIFSYFLASMCSSEGFKLLFALVWNFKDEKTKKAATEAQIWN